MIKQNTNFSFPVDDLCAFLPLSLVMFLSYVVCMLLIICVVLIIIKHGRMAECGVWSMLEQCNMSIIKLLGGSLQPKY